jgi:hypothetical protein
MAADSTRERLLREAQRRGVAVRKGAATEVIAAQLANETHRILDEKKGK